MRRLRKAVSILAGLVAVIAIVVYFILQLPEFGGRFESKRLEPTRRSPEFIGGRFENTPPQKTDPSLLKICRL